MKPRIFSGFLKKIYYMNLCILKVKMPFKMHKIIYIFQKKKVCLPYLKFSDPLPETHFFFIWPQHRSWTVKIHCLKSVMEKLSTCKLVEKKDRCSGIMARVWLTTDFDWFNSLRPGQQIFSYTGTGLPRLNHYLARINVSCSRTQHSDSGQARTCGP